MNIETYGSGERMRLVASLARNIAAKHLVLLPIPSTKDKQHITNTDITVWQTLTGVGEGSAVFGYGLPEEYKSSAEGLGAAVFDLALDEEFLKENAQLTALGTVGYLLTSSDISPGGMKIGIFGYGRIGSELTRLLLLFGADVRVYTSKEATRIDLGACGVDTVSTDGTEGGVYDFSDLDILINTAPRNMSSSFPSGRAEGLRVIELASGENFAGVEGIERLPALPERMFPKSAAEAYISAVRRLL